MNMKDDADNKKRPSARLLHINIFITCIISKIAGTNKGEKLTMNTKVMSIWKFSLKCLF